MVILVVSFLVEVDATATVFFFIEDGISIFYGVLLLILRRSRLGSSGIYGTFISNILWVGNKEGGIHCYCMEANVHHL